MDAVAGFNFHRGCLAIGERGPSPTVRGIVSNVRRVLALEQIANPDNVGSLFRSAAALGVGAVLVDSACSDPLYRKAIRTSMGAVLQLPFARADDWHGALAEIRADGITLVALTPAADAVPLRDVAPRLRQQRLAIVVGHEGDGLSDRTLALADVRVRVPLEDGVDSLNVAVAGAIAMYEMRSRSA